MNTTTQKPGVASPQPDPDVNNDEVVVETRSPRDIQLEAMGARQEEARSAHIAEGLDGDPGAAHIQAELVDAQAANRAEAEAAGLLEPLEDDGAASVEPMHEPAPEPVRDDLPETLQADPLSEFIVMDGDEAMFVTKINGENVLVPLAEARRKLQIRTAAEVEMKNSRLFAKNLETRAQAIDAGEAALKARLETVPQVQNPAIPTEQAGMTEKEIAAEARAFVGSAFADDEDTAADKLTKLLLKTRTPMQAAPVAAPPVDVQGLIRQATADAVQTIDAREQKKDLVRGIETFEDKYPEIVGDAQLYGMADNMTDDIAMEHPEWPKSQVMMEAGKRTRKWIEDLTGTGTTVEDDDPVPTEDVVISEHTPPPQPNRQARKQGLVRLPQAATAVQTSQEEPVRMQTPAEALAETRAARGQH